MNDDETKLSILTPPKVPDFLYDESKAFERLADKRKTKFEPLPEPPLSRWKIAAVILLGVFFIGMAFFLIGSDKIALFIESFDQEERKAQAETQAKIERLKLQQKLNEERVQQERIKAEEQQRMLMEEKRQQQLKLFEKLQKEDVQGKEKQAKWELFYRKSRSPLCIEPKEWNRQVQCANERLQAEERFETLYKAGKL
jgi:hypothetical protein